MGLLLTGKCQAEPHPRPVGQPTIGERTVQGSMSLGDPTTMSPLERDTERTPLLANFGDFDEPKPKPLPWRPIIVLLLLNSVQPLAYEVIFPFISM